MARCSGPSLRTTCAPRSRYAPLRHVVFAARCRWTAGFAVQCGGLCGLLPFTCLQPIHRCPRQAWKLLTGAHVWPPQQKYAVAEWLEAAALSDAKRVAEEVLRSRVRLASKFRARLWKATVAGQAKHVGAALIRYGIKPVDDEDKAFCSVQDLNW